MLTIATVLLFGIGVVLMLIVGFYCLLTTRNLIRALIGLELLTKGVTLLLIAGRLRHRPDRPWPRRWPSR